ncbi:MAG TPA: hypothetical protein VHE78_04400 [Gemmatimonadaceae bacterium]|nr:hypothetical protein [Gemmatimonadaceae bacterium]
MPLRIAQREQGTLGVGNKAGEQFETPMRPCARGVRPLRELAPNTIPPRGRAHLLRRELEGAGGTALDHPRHAEQHLRFAIDGLDGETRRVERE